MNNKIKSLICLLLALCLAFSLIGCSPAGGNTDTSSDNSTADNSSDDLDDLTDDDDLDDDSLEDDWSDEDDWEDDWSEENDWDDDWSDDEEDWEEDDWSDEEDWDEDEEDDESYMQEIGIHNTTPINTNFKGINGVYNLWNGINDKYGRNYTEEQIELEFQRLDDMDLEIIRSYYGSALAWDGSTQSWDFEKTEFKQFISNCLIMQEMGTDIGITPQWNFKGLLDNTVKMTDTATSIGISHAHGLYVDGDPSATFKNLGDFMRRSVLAFKANGVYNIKYFFCFTECNNSFVSDNPDAETQLEKRDYDKLIPLFDEAIRELDSGLKKSGLRNEYKIVAPCDNWRADDGSEDYSRLVRHCLENLYDEVDIIGSHRGYARSSSYIDDNYNYIPRENLGECCNESLAADKEFWIDEYNASVTSRNSSAEYRLDLANSYKGPALAAMVTALMDMGVSTTFLWQIASPQWPGLTSSNGEFENGVQINGFLPSFFESYTPYAPWYACSLITKYLGTGSVYRCDEGLSVYAGYNEREDGNVTLIVVNFNIEDAELKYTFDESLGGKTLYRYIYNPEKVEPTAKAEMIKYDAVAENVTTCFYDTLGAYEVAIYTTMAD